MQKHISKPANLGVNPKNLTHDHPKRRTPGSEISSLNASKDRISLLILCIAVTLPFLVALGLFTFKWNGLRHNDDYFGVSNSNVTSKPSGNFDEREKTEIFFITDERKDHLLLNIINVLEYIGFSWRIIEEKTNWDVLWAIEYPFQSPTNHLIKNLQRHQKVPMLQMLATVNHFPGTHQIAVKVHLATSESIYIPPAFKLPTDAKKLLAYAQENPKTLFVEKNNHHRGVRIKKVTEIDFDSNEKFVQKFIERPLLIDGFKFDIGIHTIITSIDPLRVYILNDEVVLRFCTQKYYPFKDEFLAKYVIAGNYRTVWDIPSLATYFVDGGFASKDSLSSYLQSVGKDSNKMWMQIEEAIAETIHKGEAAMVKAASEFKSKRNFFEMFRFDFVVDEDMTVFLLEANMTPNLSTSPTQRSRQRHEQLVYSLFSLVGIGRKIRSNSLAPSSTDELEMQVTDKNLAVFPETCDSAGCRESCASFECQLCKRCQTPELKETLADAYLEHVNKMGFKRIVPPTFAPEDVNNTYHEIYLTPSNQLMHRWFEGKCAFDQAWCSC